MLRQPKAVRESFITRGPPAARTRRSCHSIWMLRQTDKVRESFVREVLEAP